MKKMKRILSLLMALCLLLGDVVTPAMAADLGQTEMEATEEAVVETEVRETIEETTVPEETAAPVQTEVPETEAAEPVETEIPETEAAELEIPEVTEEALLTEEEDQEEQLKLTPETVLWGTLTEEQDEYTCTYEVPEAGTICLYLDSVAEGVTANITLTVGEEIVSPVDGTLTKELAAGSQITICITAEPAGEVKWSGTFTLAETPDEEEPVVPEETVVPFGAEGFSGEVTLTQETTEVEVSEIYEAPCDGWLTASAEAKYITANAVLVVDGKNVDQEARVKTGTRVQVRISADKIWKETEITWSVAFAPDEGTYLRPAEPESINEVSVDLESGDSDGYYYSHKATETGTYSFEVTEVTEGIDVSLKVIKNGEDQDNLGAVDVEKDDDLLIHVIADKDENDAYPAAKITWKATFTYPEGSYQNPILLKDWNVEGSGIQAELTLTDVPVGKTWYRIPNAVGMTLTINGEQSGKLPAWELGRTEAVFFIERAEETDSAYELKIFWPEGTVNNPKVLTEVSGETVTLVDGGYCYTYEVESSGTYIFSLAEGEKGDIIVTVVDDVKNVEKRLSGDGVEGNLAIQAEAGNILEILVTSDNAEITWNLTAEYAEGSKENPYQICVAKGKSVVLPAAEDWVSEDSTKAVVDKGKAKVTAKGAVGETVRLSATVDGETTWYKVLITMPVTAVKIIDDRFSTPEKDFEVNGKTGQIDVAVRDKALASGETVYAEWDLSVKVLPDEETVCQQLLWTSSNEEWATVIVKEDGNIKIILKEAGVGKTVTITGAAIDGSGKKASVKIKINRAVDGLRFENAPAEVAAGKSLKLAEYLVVENANATNKKVTWALAEESTAYAKLSATGVLTAGSKAEVIGQTVKVICTAQDSSGKTTEHTVTIRPAATAVELYRNEDEIPVNVAGNTLTVALEAATEDLPEQAVLTLAARVAPYGNENPVLNAGNLVKWTSSSEKYASVENGVVTLKSEGAGKTVTITATAQDGTNKKASVKIKIIRPVRELNFKAETPTEVAAGKTLKLANYLQLIPDTPTNKKVTWEITKGEEYAKISSAGVLTAYKDAVGGEVTVSCKAQDGFGAKTEWHGVVKPIATAVEITGAPADGVFILKAGEVNTLQLKASVCPYDNENDLQNAGQAVDWKSSSSVVTVSKDGLVTFDAKSAGKTVTITATAADGSNKKATVKLKVVQPVESLSWTGSVDAENAPVIAVGQGKSQKLASLVKIDQDNATNKKLNWVLLDVNGEEIDSKIATVKSGTLKAVKVTEIMKACVVVTPLDGYMIDKDTPVCEPLKIQVWLYPVAVTRIAIVDDRFSTPEKEFEVNGMTGQIEVLKQEDGKGVANWDLSVKVYPEIGACRQLLWTTSNKEWATVIVNDDGNITVELKEAGIGKTVTITGTAIDGSGKKASIKIKIVEKKPETSAT